LLKQKTKTMNIDEIIKEMQTSIDYSRKLDEPEDEANWFDHTGVLLTIEQADALIQEIRLLSINEQEGR